MPPPEHLRVTFSGVLGSVVAPVEEFSCNISLGMGTHTPPTRVELTAFAAILFAEWDELVAGIATAAIMTRCRVALVGDDGLVPKDAFGAYIQGDADGATAGTQPSIPPFQCALVYSLRTNQAGNTGRGRFYLPLPPVNAMLATGRLPTATADGHRTRGLAFLDNINAASELLLFGRVVVASGGSAAQGVAPGLPEVVRLEVGDVVDTQQRRRRSLDDVYSVGVLAP